jgi:hypothetical protein
LLLQHFLLLRGGQFAPESGGQFPAESVVSLRRNQVVNISEFSKKWRDFSIPPFLAFFGAIIDIPPFLMAFWRDNENRAIFLYIWRDTKVLRHYEKGSKTYNGGDISYPGQISGGSGH